MHLYRWRRFAFSPPSPKDGHIDTSVSGRSLQHCRDSYQHPLQVPCEQVVIKLILIDKIQPSIPGFIFIGSWSFKEAEERKREVSKSEMVMGASQEDLNG
jgi:hypothetical protein